MGWESHDAAAIDMGVLLLSWMVLPIVLFIDLDLAFCEGRGQRCSRAKKRNFRVKNPYSFWFKQIHLRWKWGLENFAKAIDSKILRSNKQSQNCMEHDHHEHHNHSSSSSLSPNKKTMIPLPAGHLEVPLHCLLSTESVWICLCNVDITLGLSQLDAEQWMAVDACWCPIAPTSSNKSAKSEWFLLHQHVI